MRIVLFVIAVSSVGGACAQSPPPAGGQAFPSRPTHLVVATTAGGSPDLIARAISRPAEIYLGQNISVCIGG